MGERKTLISISPNVMEPLNQRAFHKTSSLNLILSPLPIYILLVYCSLRYPHDESLREDRASVRPLAGPSVLILSDFKSISLELGTK